MKIAIANMCDWTHWSTDEMDLQSPGARYLSVPERIFDGVEGWGLHPVGDEEKFYKLFQLCRVPGTYGGPCISDTCLHYTHSAPDWVYRILPRRGKLYFLWEEREKTDDYDEVVRYFALVTGKKVKKVSGVLEVCARSRFHAIARVLKPRRLPLGVRRELKRELENI